MPRYQWEEKDLFGWVLNHDQEIDGPHGWIQWKGTNVCMDLHCVCGTASHMDTDFLYFFECSDCHRKYAVGQTVKLIELTDGIKEKYESDIKDVDFKTDEEPWA